MIPNIRNFLAAFLLLGCGAAFAEDGDLPRASLEIPAIEDFLSEADYWSPELSPSGRYVASIRRVEGKDFVLLLDLDAEDFSPKYIPLGDVYGNWIDWVSEDRLLVSLTGYIDHRSGRGMTREEVKAYDGTGRLVPSSFTRLVSIERESNKMAVMFSDEKRLAGNRSLGRVTDFLPNDPDHILMPARLGGDLDLFRVNVIDGSVERIAVGTDYTYKWYTDRNGEPAFRVNTNSRGTVIYIYARVDRENGQTKWKKVRTIRLNADRDSEPSLEFQILHPGPTETTYYVSARPEGEEFAAIYLYDFETDTLLDLIKRNEEVDIEDAVFNTDTQELLGVYYFKDRLVTEMEDPSIQAHLEALDDYFDNAANIVPIDSGTGGKRWLLQVSGPTEPVTYYIYDSEATAIEELGALKLSLRGKSLGPAEVVKYTARDGAVLRGYLTRPANAGESGGNPPLIVMPHGGPESRDYMDYDTEVQILVSWGYQVFQPNFRGSSGFGKSFADAGRREWGKRMQTDVDDGYDFLVAEGKADAGEACIMGGSYGGYAALAAATLTPDKYNCIIAYAAVSDLIDMLYWERREEGAQSEAYAYWVEHIGHPGQDKDALAAVSPARIAEKVTRPVLIMHGAEDGIVPLQQGEQMAEALTAAGKQVRFVEFEDSGHTYMSDEDRLTYYSELQKFLSEHLPVN